MSAFEMPDESELVEDGYKMSLLRQTCCGAPPYCSEEIKLHV